MGVSEGGEGEDKEGVKEEVEDVQGSHAHPRPWDLLWSHGPPQGLQVCSLPPNSYKRHKIR